MTIEIMTKICANSEEMKRISDACSVLQDLEHLYDGVDNVKRFYLGNAIDVLLDIINDEDVKVKGDN